MNNKKGGQVSPDRLSFNLLIFESFNILREPVLEVMDDYYPSGKV